MITNNSGYGNSGNRNSGHWNSGYGNSGNGNSGHWNSGHWNSGDRNSGNRNSGYGNSGHWNSGHGNSGSFNRDCPKMRLFEKELDMTVEEFYEQHDLSMDLPLNVWVDESNMTNEEKNQNNGWETTGGFLRTLDYKDACRKWWADNPDDHKRFLSLPGFDWEIFTEITGIKSDEPQETKAEEVETITLNGKMYRLVEDADE